MIYPPFLKEVIKSIKSQEKNKLLNEIAQRFKFESAKSNYSYNFTWLGRPIIQYPQDMVAIQEVIYKVKPDLIIETGIAHGGSLILSASMLALLDMEEKNNLDVTKRKVLGIDIDIRAHNKIEIEKHFLYKYIHMIEGSSISESTIEKVKLIAKDFKKILVFLDSNHTHEHVFKELEAYSNLVSLDSYCIVFDTIIEEMPEGTFPNRDWSPGNNPMTAVHQFLDENNNFIADNFIDNKLLISVAKNGYLKKIKNN